MPVDTEVAGRAEPSRNGATRPRTNREMSEETRRVLLEATLDCLTEYGYAGTSTNDVVKRAGVTRGALTHHFAAKADLVAEAAALLVRRRADDELEIIRQGVKGDLGERLRQKREITQKRFPAMIEFMIAARTDEHLRKHFSEAIKRHFPESADSAATLFPEFSARPDPMLTHYVINCFIRGLLLETVVNSNELVEKVFEEFVDLLVRALAK